eukprot:scaffold4790_cov98-Cylindrotheca_fusiformis.AAC.1
MSRFEVDSFESTEFGMEKAILMMTHQKNDSEMGNNEKERQTNSKNQKRERRRRSYGRTTTFKGGTRKMSCQGERSLVQSSTRSIIFLLGKRRKSRKGAGQQS